MIQTFVTIIQTIFTGEPPFIIFRPRNSLCSGKNKHHVWRFFKQIVQNLHCNTPFIMWIL